MQRFAFGSVLALVLSIGSNLAPATEPDGDKPPAAPTSLPDHATPPVVPEEPAGCPCSPCVLPFVPTMFGDLVGPFPDAPFTVERFLSFSRQAGEIASARGAFKIGENESPRPQDRLFVQYNGYYNVRGNLNEIDRTTFGFEKTTPGGWASFGMRLPFFHMERDFASIPFEDEVLGDLSFIFKFAFVNAADRVVSAGLVLTTPTSPDAAFVLPSGEEVHATLLQPFAGYYGGSGPWYLHGFTAAMFSTDADDVSIFFQDLGLGYRLERGDRLVQAVVPTAEVHVNIPLNHRSETDLSRFRDNVNITAGSHFVFRRASIGAAVGCPVTGPRPFELEAIVNFNWRF